MASKTSVIGTVASGLIIILLVLGPLTTQQYRDELTKYPAANYILLNYQEDELLEFLTRGETDFLRWKYTTDQ